MKHMGVEGLRLMVADVVSGLRVGVGLEPAVSFVTPANWVILLTLSLPPGNTSAGVGVAPLSFKA